MLKRKKNIIILILVTVLLIVAVILCMIYRRTNCLNKGKIYHNDHIFSAYDRLYKEYGKPQKEYASTYNKIECWVACYDGVTAVYAYDSEEQEKDYLINAVISSDNFWKGKSFIGWKQSKIKKKFKYSRQAYPSQEIIHTYFNDGSKMDYEVEPYYDDYWIYGIGFIYDEDNIVEKVVLTCGLH